MNTKHSQTRRVCSTALMALGAIGLAAAFAAPVAHADDVVATSSTTLVAAAQAPTTSTHRGPAASAGIPNGIIVTGHSGYPVSISASGEPTLRVSRPGDAPARFTGLTPGTTYTVAVNERPVAKVTAISRPRPATSLTVRSTKTSGSVKLTWKHPRTKGTGGSAVSYTVTAKPTTGRTITTTVKGRTSTTLTGLDPHMIYTFTVTPKNSAGAGRPTTATMTRPLAGPASSSPTVPVTPPASPPADQPKPISETARPAAPTTKTIYVCAEGFSEAGGLCHAYLPYTFDTRAYTFHDVATGPQPLISQYETTGGGCPAGWKFEDYGWVRYCRLWGPAPTMSVKDEAPAGFTDNGTEWVRKAPAPAGYLDNGTAWEKTAPLEARIVAA